MEISLKDIEEYGVFLYQYVDQKENFDAKKFTPTRVIESYFFKTPIATNIGTFLFVEEIGYKDGSDELKIHAITKEEIQMFNSVFYTKNWHGFKMPLVFKRKNTGKQQTE